MKLFGITGRMRAGKDSFFSIVAERHPAVRLAFADELKAECAAACGVTVLEINERKAVFRPLLQWWGTDFRRAADPEYWLKRMAARLDTLPEDALVFVTDVRFENEAALIRSRAGDIIRVVRSVEPEANGLAGHASETEQEAIAADYTVSAANLAELRDAVNHWLNKNLP
jgi:hypothetical protein